MTPRDVIFAALDGRTPPYVPWQLGFTAEARHKLHAHFGDRLETVLHNHQAWFGVDRMDPAGNDRVRDIFGVTWDRSRDKDIGVVEGRVLPGPSLAGLCLPEVAAAMEGLEPWAATHGERFRVFALGFSLYERAWTLRGMEELLVDMHEEPAFVHDLLDAVADWNIAQVRRAAAADIDGVYFGDDWGSQKGLQMGPDKWREFVKPRLARMYGAVKAAGKRVFIHSCGDVDELFDELVELGLDCFDPFQPEVMDVEALMVRYRGRLSFHGGLSTQRTLPYGSAADVRRETRRLLELGRHGNYIFSPAHAVEGDVPLQNMLAFLEELRAQPGFPGR